ncbi:hypothetical protein ENBRE01_0073 [Enteropsectra breve]|nr:hypothetical protein ENBRE01_0073 [Enteropsectra breve]
MIFKSLEKIKDTENNRVYSFGQIKEKIGHSLYTVSYKDTVFKIHANAKGFGEGEWIRFYGCISDGQIDAIYCESLSGMDIGVISKAADIEY